MQEGTGGGWQGWMESCICWVSGPSSTFPAKRDMALAAWARWHAKSGAPFLIVQTGELPRGAQIEWQITWQTGRRVCNDDVDSDDDDEGDLLPVRRTESLDGECSVAFACTTTEVHFGIRWSFPLASSKQREVMCDDTHE